MRAVVDTLERVVEYDANLLLLGESGVGKDHVARIIHRPSGRSAGPFVTIDCASIPANLFESELFGHEKGAFTDAKEARPGKLELGTRGTVYLDEIGAIDLSLQAKLLRVLDEKEYSRVGGRASQELDVRFISSSNLNLQEAVEEGSFRPDLYYRLNVVSVEIPPLRERREDIIAIARRMMKDACSRYGKNVTKLSPAVESILKGHTWPGNLRELASVIDACVLASESEVLGVSALPRDRFGSGAALVGVGLSERWSLEELEDNYIRAVIADCGGNYSRAARVLGISRKSLLEKRRRYGIDDPGQR